MVVMARTLAKALGVKGLMNVQFAIAKGDIYVLEVNPRASRTIPFVSKATGINWAKVATRCIVGRTLADQGIKENLNPDKYAVKEVVFPFSRFENINPFLGPEMRSTGEVMGIAETISEAYSKALYASGTYLPCPDSGQNHVFVSVNDHDKERILPLVKKLVKLGFNLVCTKGTGRMLEKAGLKPELVYKVKEGRPNIIDRMKNNEIVLVINTPLGRESYYDEKIVGETAYRMGIPLITTLPAATAALDAIEAIGIRPLKPLKLQDL
jgi:carbamoyl-phosphate synthase large subunit